MAKHYRYLATLSVPLDVHEPVNITDETYRMALLQEAYTRLMQQRGRVLTSVALQEVYEAECEYDAQAQENLSPAGEAMSSTPEPLTALEREIASLLGWDTEFAHDESAAKD